MEIEILKDWILEAFAIGDTSRAHAMSLTLNLLLQSKQDVIRS